MKLRVAMIDDALAISEVRVAAWRAAYQEFMPSGFLAALDPKHDLRHWQERLGQPPSGWHSAVVENDQKVVGFVVLGPPRFQTSMEVSELWALNVHPSFWHCGIGSMLAQHAVATARSMGNKTVELWCIRGNVAAQTTYERCGFHATGQARTSSALTGNPLQEMLYAKAL